MVSRSLSSWLVMAGLSLMASSGIAADKETTPGLKVGQKAPDFELKDQLGKPKKLSKLLEQGTVAIVFHRSADW